MISLSITDGEMIYEIPGSSLDEATGAQIPEEPSYLIINTAGKQRRYRPALLALSVVCPHTAN